MVPTVEEIIASKKKQVLLIGTARTISSKKYERELQARNATSVVLKSIATPRIVPLIEAGALNEAYAHIEKLITPLIGEIELLVLRCTHYAFLTSKLRKRFEKILIISQDEIIPKKLLTYLTLHLEMNSRLTRGGSCEYFYTGIHREIFLSVGNRPQLNTTSVAQYIFYDIYYGVSITYPCNDPRCI